MENQVKNALMSPGQEEALETLRNWMIGAGATGVAARSLVGAGDLFGKRQLPKMQSPLVVDVPYKIRKKQEEEMMPPTMMPKVAGSQSWSQWLAGQGLPSGEGYNAPWFIPALGLGVPAAGAGGWHIMDKVLRARKKQNLEDELEDAKTDMRTSELGKFKPLELGKMSADYTAIINGNTPEDKNLKQAADNLSKLAEVGLNPTSWPWGAALGTYGLLAGLGGTGAGYVAYNYARNMDPAKRKAKAMKDQLEEAERGRPPEIFARLVPTDEAGNRIPRRQQRMLESESPESLAPGSVKMGDDLEARAHQFVTNLFGRSVKNAQSAQISTPKSPAGGGVSPTKSSPTPTTVAPKAVAPATSPFAQVPQPAPAGGGTQGWTRVSPLPQAPMPPAQSGSAPIPSAPLTPTPMPPAQSGSAPITPTPMPPAGFSSGSATSTNVNPVTNPRGTKIINVPPEPEAAPEAKTLPRMIAAPTPETTMAPGGDKQPNETIMPGDKAPQVNQGEAKSIGVDGANKPLQPSRGNYSATMVGSPDRPVSNAAGDQMARLAANRGGFRGAGTDVPGAQSPSNLGQAKPMPPEARLSSGYNQQQALDALSRIPNLQQRRIAAQRMQQAYLRDQAAAKQGPTITGVAK